MDYSVYRIITGTAEEFVANRIITYLNDNDKTDDVIVKLSVSEDGEKWTTFNAYAITETTYGTVKFIDDWWEGEQFIKILEIRLLSEVI